MGSTKPSAKRTDTPPARLVEALAKRMGESLLPGDTPFEKRRLREAAEFLLATGLTRETRRSAIAIESTSGEKRMLRIAIVNDDMPFLVDSAAATIAAAGLSIDRLVHPVVPIERDAEGNLTGFGKGGSEDAPYESMIYIETPRVDARQRRDLMRALRETMGDVRAAVADWPKVQQVMLADAERIEPDHPEGAALLRWLNGGMLTQLGHLVRRRDGEISEPLGICRRSARELLAEASYERAFAWFENEANTRLPLIIKANRLSLVHRHVPLDLFLLPLRENGKLVALSVHAGVWTSAALAAPPRDVPRLRSELEAIMGRLDFDRGGHAGKALVHALTTLPHDLLIGFSAEDIERVSTTMMSLVDRPRPRLALVEAPLARHLFAFVWLPRDMLSTQVREQIQQLLEQGASARMLDWSLEVEGGTIAMMRFVLDIRDGDGAPDEAALDHHLQTLLRGWTEAVETELAELVEPGRAAALALRWAESFPTPFRGRFGAQEAATDIARLHALGVHSDSDAPRQRDARLYYCERETEACLRLKLYQAEGSLPLSDAVPALENFGFHVHTEMPFVLDEGRLGTIHDFRLTLPAGTDAAALVERSDAIEEAVAAVLNGEAENDVFNRLVCEASLSARQTGWLRAFYRYLRQAGMGFTIYTVVDALRGAPEVTRALVALFAARHDPDFGSSTGKGREEAVEEAKSAIKRGLSRVVAINDDRLLRLYHQLIDAILRTNAYAPAAEEALAFKIDSSLVPNLPKPIPWREIFVYSRRVEGIHLRSGAIARGGLRWSDRRDDFRTEILGLMKAQRVKNAVIVPTGAKGGFYPKQLPSPVLDRDGWAAEGQGSYEAFIRTLLSVTDNIVDDKVVHPQDVVIHDGEDPYFVVAADKGTAKFSDIANGIAESRGFWLDDAFASGGSNGYDHKAMGITAKGAWVSVQRHFLEMGVDVQSEPVEVVGCGDMSGDVFGNGMLLSKAIKLVAAFDHRHIFIDPDPDPAASWAERQRMFDLPRSSWEDYDRSLISKGGGIFARDAKSIKLSKQARKALAIEDSEIEPEALISAILKAPADLIWFGGIGTYIKAGNENNAQVGDPANDTLRVDASEIRAKVIGEGANLGVTQAGRIEFALGGGRINTDFIDNSAGVDCSDNEVNIKIALAAARRAGRLSEAKRNALLKDMTDEVARLVLEDNRLQALALSIAELGGPKVADAQLRLIETLEDNGNLDRRTEGLADHETLGRRIGDGRGLTRPELAVLLSSTKLLLQDAIENGPLSASEALEPLLIEAFPEPMRKPYRAQILHHRLRRQLVATKLANRIVNRIGLVHPFELAEEEGATLEQVATAFVLAVQLYDMEALWADIDGAAMPEHARLTLFDHAAKGLRIQMADLLCAGVDPADPQASLEALGQGVERLSTASQDLLENESRLSSSRLQSEFAEAGAPEALAARVAHLFEMDGAVGLAKLARQTDIDVFDLTGAFTALGAELGLDWAQAISALMSPSDVWERLLVGGLARDFQQMRFDFLRRLARRKGAKEDMPAMVGKWVSENAAGVRNFRTMIGRAQAQSPVAPAMLAQVASMARNLLGK
ncbi:NAD-glutamate dehydrogenase [Qipengyuania sp. MTN3-11]|uniref:NAD-glutamate dehydrogenase n=1 Tax=Qipengyuania sp. MTN3-11 TaxID=3056557 RepID=UPI0036F1A31A